MISVVQRVSHSSVSVEETCVGEIGQGILLLVGIEKGDTEEDISFTVRKVTELRIFPDEIGKMNRSITDAGGAILAVSQFTLAADIRKGRRPSFDTAMPPDEAQTLFGRLVQRLSNLGIAVATGSFGAHMEVSLVNDGPVTFIIDSRKRI